MNKEIRCSTP